MKREFLKRSGRHVWLLCSLAVLMTVASGCEKAKLKSAVAIVNKQCPLDLGNGEKMTDIRYEDNYVTCTISTNEEYTDMKGLQEDPELAKILVRTMLANPDKDAKKLLRLIADGKAGMRMVYIDRHSGKQAVIEMSPDEMGKVLSTKIDPAQAELQKLKVQVAFANRLIDGDKKDPNEEEVTTEKLEITSTSVVYLNTVHEALLSLSDIEESAADVQEEITAYWRDSSDPSLREFLTLCVNNNKDITYRYVGDQSGKVCDITLSLDKLKEIIAQSNNKKE